MRKILITGGAGFIASCLAEKLSENSENHIVIVDDLSTGALEKIPHSKNDNVRFIKADVNIFEDISNIFFSFQPDYVFHYAAMVGVKRTLENPVKVLNDVSGIKNILNLSKSTGVKRVYYSSSSEVYGEPVELPQHEETTPLNSRLPYAIVKNIGEAYMKSYKKEFDLDYTVFRFFNTYGPKQAADFVISKFIKHALKNVDIEMTILDLAKTIIKVANSKSKIVHLAPLPEGDMTRRMPDATKMKQLLAHSFLPLEEGLKKVLSDTKYILGK